MTYQPPPLQTQGLRNICASLKPISSFHFMRLRDSLTVGAGGLSIALRYCAPALLAAMLACGARAQIPAAPTPSHTPQPAPVLGASDTWTALTPKQKISLAPLEKSWGGLSEGQKRKWRAISESYPGLAQPEQEKLHSRMAEWAALSPKDREVARLNFAQSKTVTKSDRAANWEAYQALSPEEREKLARGSKVKPVGAAVVAKPVAAEKLTAVPVTRHTPEQERAAAVLQRPINRSTLLPQVPASGPSASPMATPAKP
jgi:Protein of unknown function (DUF3106)